MSIPDLPQKRFLCHTGFLHDSASSVKTTSKWGPLTSWAEPSEIKIPKTNRTIPNDNTSTLFPISSTPFSFCWNFNASGRGRIPNTPLKPLQHVFRRSHEEPLPVGHRLLLLKSFPKAHYSKMKTDNNTKIEARPTTASLHVNLMIL